MSYEISDIDAEQLHRTLCIAVLGAKYKGDIIRLNKAIVVLEDIMGIEYPEDTLQQARNIDWGLI